MECKFVNLAKKVSFLSLSLMFLSSGILYAAESSTKTQLLNVQKNYTSHKERLDDEYANDCKRNRTILVEKLTPIIAQLTSANRIDHALKVQNAKKSLEAGKDVDLEELDSELKFTALRSAISQYQSIAEKIDKKLALNSGKLCKETIVQLQQIGAAAKKAGDLNGFLEIEKLRKDVESKSEVAKPIETGSTGGWSCQIYEGKFRSVNDFEKTGKLVGKPFISSVRIPASRIGKDFFGLVFKGYFHAPKTGNYTFELSCDDGGTFSIDGKLLIGLDGTHAIVKKATPIELKSGWHPIELRYFDYHLDEILKLEVGFDKETPKAIPTNQMKGMR